jgi:hypothetical protein
MGRLHRCLVRTSLVATLVLGASAASAATVEADLATSEMAYASLDYGSALSAAESVLAQRGLGHDVLTRATRVAALSHAALGHVDQARQLFTVLLQYDPDFKVDAKLGPRFSEPFAEARGFWQAQGRKPSMDVLAVVQWGETGQIRVVTVDPLNVVKRVAISYRWSGTREYKTDNVDAGARNIEVPANSEKQTRLDYFVRALDSKDNAVFEDGTPEGPKSVSVAAPQRSGPAEQKRSIFASPVFYVVGGALLAGAAAGSYFAFRPTEYTPTTAARSNFQPICGNDKCN